MRTMSLDEILLSHAEASNEIIGVLRKYEITTPNALIILTLTQHRIIDAVEREVKNK